VMMDYHHWWVRRSGCDSYQPRHSYEPLVITITIGFSDTGGDRDVGDRSICSSACQPKDQGGLGIHNLGIKNTTLLSKWLFKLLTSYGTWQQILQNKYLWSKPLSQLEWKAGDLHF
jgi:hypothetical protein